MKAPWKPYGTLHGDLILATGSLEKFFVSIIWTCKENKYLSIYNNMKKIPNKPIARYQIDLPQICQCLHCEQKWWSNHHLLQNQLLWRQRQLQYKSCSPQTYDILLLSAPPDVFFSSVIESTLDNQINIDP